MDGGGSTYSSTTEYILPLALGGDRAPGGGPPPKRAPHEPLFMEFQEVPDAQQTLPPGPLTFFQDGDNSELGGPLNHAAIAFIVSTLAFIVMTDPPKWIKSDGNELSWSKVLMVSSAVSLIVYSISSMARNCG